MMGTKHAIFGGLAIVGAGTIGFWLYKTYGNTAENDTSAAIKLGLGASSNYVPQLPINPKSIPSTSPASPYHLVKVSKKYKDGIVPARDTDYYNPAQLYATTGPKGLQPTRVAEQSIKDRSATLV